MAENALLDLQIQGISVVNWFYQKTDFFTIFVRMLVIFLRVFPNFSVYRGVSWTSEFLLTLVNGWILLTALNVFYEQPVHTEVALGWQIAKQLSGSKLFSLSSKKNYRYIKVEFFLCNKCKIVVKTTIHQNPAVSKALLHFLQTWVTWSNH